MPAPHHPADFPQLIKSLLPTPRQIAPDTEIVSDGLMRYRYRDLETRLQRLGAGLAGQGIGAGSLSSVGKTVSANRLA